MKKVAILLAVVLLATASFAAAPKTTAKAAASGSRMTISPKLSYVGYLGIGCEFAPLYKITPDVDLMAEANWDFWSGWGGSGYVYGELNAVYHAKPFKMEGQQAPLEPYAGGGLIYGFPMGTPTYSGVGGSASFSGGIGFAIFGGVTGKMDPYTWYAHLKYASAPITYNWSVDPIPGWYSGTSGSESTNALGAGMEFGVRFPL